MGGTEVDREFEAELVESLPSAFHSALMVLQNHADAEDVTQDALIRAYRFRFQLRDPRLLRPWLACISRRLALNKMQAERRRRPAEVITDTLGHFHTTAMDSLIIQERSDRLWNAIDALPQHLKSVTVLIEMEERSIHEVAHSLRLPEGTVKSRLFRARRKLKEVLTNKAATCTR
jgi:RNA polymerase sigma-70 factor (ECF subfamily)